MLHDFSRFLVKRLNEKREAARDTMEKGVAKGKDYHILVGRCRELRALAAEIPQLINEWTGEDEDGKTTGTTANRTRGAARRATRVPGSDQTAAVRPGRVAR